jgi:hypothetical protein
LMGSSETMLSSRLASASGLASMLTTANAAKPDGVRAGTLGRDFASLGMR